MPGLSFQNQGNRYSPSGSGPRMPGGWILPVVLIVLSIAIITLGVRFENGGPLGAARSGVQAVTKPIEAVCSGISAPFKAFNTPAPSEDAEELERQNEQLKALVAELEEYRQQNQRLISLVQLSDTYSLATTSANVLGATSGWSRVATIDKGAEDGLRPGMGVISSCGLYGQIESTASRQSTVRLITDSNSSVSAMVQNSRARGILRGSYDGALTLEFVSTEYTVGEGDFVITSGDGGTYPNGIIIGTVKSAEPDPSKLYYRISVDPIFNVASCQEVLVLTGDESQVASIIDEDTLSSIKESMQAASSTAVTDALNAARTGTSETFTTGQDGSSQPETAASSDSSEAQGTQSQPASSSGESDSSGGES